MTERAKLREELKIEILAKIGRNDGNISWYRIARWMTDDKFLPIISEMGGIFKEIESEKLAEVIEGNIHLTDKGRQFNVEAANSEEK